MEGTDTLVCFRAPNFDCIVPAAWDNDIVVESNTVDAFSMPKHIPCMQSTGRPTLLQLILLLVYVVPVQTIFWLGKLLGHLHRPLHILQPIPPDIIAPRKCIPSFAHCRHCDKRFYIKKQEYLCCNLPRKRGQKIWAFVHEYILFYHIFPSYMLHCIPFPVPQCMETVSFSTLCCRKLAAVLCLRFREMDCNCRLLGRRWEIHFLEATACFDWLLLLHRPWSASGSQDVKEELLLIIKPGGRSIASKQGSRFWDGFIPWKSMERCGERGKKGNEKLFAGFYTRYNLFPPSPAKKVVYARGKEINRKRRMIQKSVETHGF